MRLDKCERFRVSLSSASSSTPVGSLEINHRALQKHTIKCNKNAISIVSPFNCVSSCGHLVLDFSSFSIWTESTSIQCCLYDDVCGHYRNMISCWRYPINCVWWFRSNYPKPQRIARRFCDNYVYAERSAILFCISYTRRYMLKIEFALAHE